MSEGDHCRFGGYRGVEWLKFSIPILTSSIAMSFCLLTIVDCKSSIQVGSEQWFGLFSHASDTSEPCVAYTEDTLPTGLVDSQLVTARVASLMVVMVGLALWIVLVLSPFHSVLNGVWPKLIGIGTALIIGNVQLLNAAKFVRFVLDGYPEEKVSYKRKGVIFCSVLFWFLTAVAISLCGVKPRPSRRRRRMLDGTSNNNNNGDSTTNSKGTRSSTRTNRSSIIRRKSESSSSKTKLEPLPEGKDEAAAAAAGESAPSSLSSRAIHLLVYETASEDTHETKDTITKDVEEGTGESLGSRSISVDTSETNEMEDIEIVLSSESPSEDEGEETGASSL